MKKPNNLTRILSVLAVLAMLLTLCTVLGTTVFAADSSECQHNWESGGVEALSDDEKEVTPMPSEKKS